MSAFRDEFMVIVKQGRGNCFWCIVSFSVPHSVCNHCKGNKGTGGGGGGGLRELLKQYLN